VKSEGEGEGCGVSGQINWLEVRMQRGKEPPALGHGVSNSSNVPPLTTYSNLLSTVGSGNRHTVHLILAEVWTYGKPPVSPT